MLIIEGPDRVGKTTLANALAARLKLPYRTLGLLPDNWDYHQDYVTRMGPAVYDRFHLSEVVYGFAIRQTVKLNSEAIRRINARLIDANAVIILITNSEKDYRARLEKDPDDKFSIDQLVDVNHCFHRLLEWREKYLIDFHCNLGADEYLEADSVHIETVLNLLNERKKWAR